MPNLNRILAKFCLLVCASLILGGCFGRSTKIQAPAPFSYPQVDYTLTVGEPIDIPAPPVLGAAIDSWSVEPELPAGLEFDSTNGSISGIPTEACPRHFFAITATNFGGS
ncbi:MAG: Ig domain-containing protein, partial [Planctomycetota bacterium]